MLTTASLPPLCWQGWRHQQPHIGLNGAHQGLLAFALKTGLLAQVEISQ